MSPVLIPADSAGLSGITLATRAPYALSKPRLDAKSSVTVWILTPNHPLIVLPWSFNCPTIFSAKKTFFVPSKLVRDELANSSKNQQNYIQEVGQTLNLKYRLFKRYVGFLFSVGYS